MSIMSRRKFLHSTAALLAAPAMAHALPVKAPMFASCGCCLSRRQAALLGPTAAAKLDVKPEDLIASSGDATTDRYLGMALLRMATVFKVSPGFAFIDGPKADNAFATPTTLAQGGPGTVLMGRDTFVKEMRNDESGMTVVAICAHEYGHIHQFMNGYHDDLAELDKTVRTIELHADFLAGFFLATRKQDYPDLSMFKVGESFFNLGDTDFNGRNHHGTSEERIAAVTAGFDLGKSGTRDIEQVAKAGIAYVRQAL
jgi:hypothetical protein